MNGQPMALRDLQAQVYQTSVSKGWWEDNARPFGDQLANMHAELSEAWEEWRNGHPMNEIRIENGKPEGVPIELADTVIRIMDTCQHYGIDLEAAIRQKDAYNQLRPYRHGGKLA